MNLIQTQLFGEDASSISATNGIVATYAIVWDDDPFRAYPADEVGACPAGWIALFERLVKKLVKMGWDRRLAQVKSKFGTARVYIGEGSREMFAAHDLYEVGFIRGDLNAEEVEGWLAVARDALRALERAR